MKNLLLFFPLAFFLLHACSSTPEQPGTQPATDSIVNPTFLFISDIHLNAFGDSCDYNVVDTGMELWKNFLAKADSVLSGKNSPLFIVYTGDLPAHYSCEDGCFIPPHKRDTHNTNLRVILDGLHELATKHNKPLFYMPGNNDGLAGDYYSFADAAQQTPLSLVAYSSNPFPAVNMRKDGQAPCLVSNPHPDMGYYSASPVAGLRLIALNSVIFSRKFQAVDHTQPDSDRVQQMDWLAAQLSDAAAKKEKVYLAMHIPPGLDGYSGKPMWADSSLGNRFLALTAQYQENIAGILYGHTHMDEVRRLYDANGKMTEVAISCPGVTPLFGNNPGFKIVEYDANNKELLNLTTFYTTPQSHSWAGNSYTFRSAYNVGDSATIFSVLNRMPFPEVKTSMLNIFTVKHGMPSYDPSGAIEVKVGQ